MPSFLATSSPDWHKMDPATQNSWTCLGWTEQSWKGSAPVPASSDCSWAELPAEQQAAASRLGYTNPLWNNDSWSPRQSSVKCLTGQLSAEKLVAILAGRDLGDDEGFHEIKPHKVIVRGMKSKMAHSRVPLGIDSEDVADHKHFSPQLNKNAGLSPMTPHIMQETREALDKREEVQRLSKEVRSHLDHHDARYEAVGTHHLHTADGRRMVNASINAKQHTSEYHRKMAQAERIAARENIPVDNHCEEHEFKRATRLKGTALNGLVKPHWSTEDQYWLKA